MVKEKSIEGLERELSEAGQVIDELFRQGKIPAPADYADIDRIKKELKTARRVKAMDEKRTEPKLTRSYTITFTEDEYKELSERAERKGMILSKYIRHLLKGESGG